MNSNEKQNKINNLKQNKNEVITEIQDTITEATNINNEFGIIKDYVHKMVELFLKAKFTSNVAVKMTYDNDTQFNEGNIT